MIRRLRLIIVIMALFWEPAASRPGHISGCLEPDELAKALKVISDGNWNDISEKDLQAKWPSDLRPVDCNGGSCQSLSNEGTIINNECGCCELFHFAIDSGSKHLSAVVIQYSAPSGDEILKVAKTLARATGLAEADAMTIKRETRRQFDWDVAGTGKQKEVASLDVAITHQRDMWHVWMSLGRYVL